MFFCILYKKNTKLKQCTIRSSRSDLSYSTALKLACFECMQMSLVDVFMVRGAEESNRWEEIATKALSLDRDDFLPIGYKVSAKFKDVASMPPWTKAKPHSSDRS